MSNLRKNEPPQHPSSEPSLEALALAEWLARVRAAGGAPRLSALIANQPGAVGDLADAAMLEAMLAEADERQVVETGAAPLPLSPGAERAVAALFEGEDASVLAAYQIAAGEDDASEDAQARVAETPALYHTAGLEAREVGLLALAHSQRIAVEALAAQVMLSPEVVRWLDQVALPREDQPDALVFHLVGALGMTSERVREALAHGVTGARVADLAERLASDESLTAIQRAYWVAQLATRQ